MPSDVAFTYIDLSLFYETDPHYYFVKQISKIMEINRVTREPHNQKKFNR